MYQTRFPRSPWSYGGARDGRCGEFLRTGDAASGMRPASTAVMPGAELGTRGATAGGTTSGARTV